MNKECFQYGSSRTLARRVIFLVCIIVCVLPSIAYAQPAAKKVLVLYWYNKDYPWNIKFDHNFQSSLRSEVGSGLDYYSEYLETNRFPGEDQAHLFRDYLKQKYASHPMDVVVAASDASLSFLLTYRTDLFPNSPVVFTASRYPTDKELSIEPGLTGILILSAQYKTADLALKIHPSAEHLYVVSGTVEHDKRLETLARRELSRIANRVEITYLTDLPLQDLISSIKNLPERSIILYLWQQARNEQGFVLESSDIFASIAPASRVPIYGMSLPLVGAGAVGGYFNTAEDSGAKTAQLVLQIVKGANAKDIPIEAAPAVPMFDWHQLQRWNIGEAQLPYGATILFKDLSLWEQHKKSILATLALIVGQAVLIAWLLAERRSRRKAEEARRHLAAIVESSNDAIIGTTLDGKILSWNNGAESMYGYTAAEALGRNVSLVVPPERWEEFNASMKLRSPGERIENLDTVRLRKNGSRVDVSVSVSPIRDGLGRIIADATITRDISERKRAQRELQDLTGRIIYLQDEERQRIAGELHDSLGQSLVIIKNRAMICLRDPTFVERVSEQLEEISSTATAAIDEVHEIAHNLRPYELDRLGLVKAIETMVRKLANSSSIEFATKLDPVDGLLAREAETSVYRIIQEGLNNVVKHSQATKASVSLKRTSDKLEIQVTDNGKGITKHHEGAGDARGLGLAGVAERARMLGGSSAVESSPHRGTKLIVILHLSEENRLAS